MGFLPSDGWNSNGKSHLNFEDKVNGVAGRLGVFELPPHDVRLLFLLLCYGRKFLPFVTLHSVNFGDGMVVSYHFWLMFGWWPDGWGRGCLLAVTHFLWCQRLVWCDLVPWRRYAIHNPSFTGNNYIHLDLFKTKYCLIVAYKLELMLLMSTPSILNSPFLLLILINSYSTGAKLKLPSSDMNKGKEKIVNHLFSEVVKSTLEPIKTPSFVEDVKLPLSSGLPQKPKTKKNARKNHKIKSGTVNGESSAGVSPINAESFLSKLSLVKENFQVLENTTLLGFLVGKHVDFNKKISKLKFDWKSLNGEVNFYDRQMGWFEIRFSNPIDKIQIWEGRPYHIFSQLLLLKPWKSDFNPATESIFKVDMWVRIPFFPPEYYNFEAISTILEFNNIGSLVKLDPNAYKRNWAKFARFCINLDCSQIVNTEIMIPNETGELKKYCLWFEDIPKGCGNCGGLDHGFNNCPLRRFIPPKFQIKFRKQVGETSQAVANDPNWVQVQGKMNKKKASKMEKGESKSNTKEEVYGGIAVVYLSDGSSFESKESSKTSSKLSKCCSANTDEVKENNGEPTYPNENSTEKACKDAMANYSPERMEASNGKNSDQDSHDDNQREDPNKDVKEQIVDCERSTLQAANTTEENESKAISNTQEEFYYDGDDEGGNFEMDYLLDEDPFLEGQFVGARNLFPLPDCPLGDDVPFFPLDSENYILNQDSIMESMQPVPSSSGSSKRKLVGGEGDTASSDVGNKKSKN